jgi:hypothetical protein
MVEARVVRALPRRIACLNETLTLAEMPAVIPERLGEVWRFLSENNVSSTGHNVCVYLPRGAAEGDLQFETYMGVEVHDLRDGHAGRCSRRHDPLGPVRPACARQHGAAPVV